MYKMGLGRDEQVYMYLKTIKKVEGYSLRELMGYENNTQNIPEEVKEVMHIENLRTSKMTLGEVEAFWNTELHIHKWFLDKQEEGLKLNVTLEVTEYQVEELLKLVIDAINNNQDMYSSGQLTAIIHPVWTWYTNEDYYRGLKDTKKQLERLLNTVNFDDFYLVYQSERHSDTDPSIK